MATPVKTSKVVVSIPEPVESVVSSVNPVEQPIPAYQWPEGKVIHVLMPLQSRPSCGAMLRAFAALYERDKMKLDVEPTSFITRGRNKLADKFLAGGCEWSLWMDDDCVPPFGDVPYFRELTNNPQFPTEFINFNPIQRLLNAKRTIVSGCYFGRNIYGAPQFAEAMTSRIANEVCHYGPRNVIAETKWAGFGFVLVHRSVFTDIISSQPELKVQNPAMAKVVGGYRFFNPMGEGEELDSSEDVSFFRKALKAGHKCYIDHAVQVAHVGETAFSYANTKIKPLVY